jgi:Dolichyl-phosphate-mannose-protein mannosyltransferase
VSIARGSGYLESRFPAGGPSAFRPPGYPYFLAGVYKVAGHRVRAARLAQALLGTAVVALIALLAWRLWDRRVALIAAALAAVYPPLIIVGTALLTESLFIPLVLGALATVVEYARVGGLEVDRVEEEVKRSCPRPRADTTNVVLEDVQADARDGRFRDDSSQSPQAPARRPSNSPRGVRRRRGVRSLELPRALGRLHRGDHGIG